jgi:hypothetical protein
MHLFSFFKLFFGVGLVKFFSSAVMRLKSSVIASSSFLAKDCKI